MVEQTGTEITELVQALRGKEIRSVDAQRIPGREISDAGRLPPAPLVSVAMITYNHEKYVGQAISSIVSQKAPFAFELVIGEDCSKDGTRQLVLDFQRRYPHIIRVLIADGNVGPTANLLRVERACRGKYIAYCEGDDFWQSLDKLRAQADFLEAHPECSAVYSGYDLLKGDDRMSVTTVPGQSSDPTRILSFDDIVFGSSFQFATCTTFGRREVIERGLAECPVMSEELSFGDVTRHLLFSAAGQVGFIPEPLATYRLDAGGASHSVSTCLRFALDGVRVKAWFVKKYRPEIRDGDARLARLCFPYVFYFVEQLFDPALAKGLARLSEACGFQMPLSLKIKVALCRNRWSQAVVKRAFQAARGLRAYRAKRKNAFHVWRS